MSDGPEPARRPAGLRSRAAARAIDAVVPCAVAAGAVALLIVVTLVVSVLSDPPQLVPIGPTDSRAFNDIFGGPIPVLSFLVLVAAALRYEPLRLLAGRQTFGKQKRGLAVVNGRGGGIEELSRAACWVRWVVPHGALVAAGGVGAVVGGLLWDGWRLVIGVGAGVAAWTAVYGSALLDSGGRGWHDKAAGTVVIAVPARKDNPPVPAAGLGEDSDGSLTGSVLSGAAAVLLVLAMSLGAGAAAAGGVFGLGAVFSGELDLYDDQVRAARPDLWREGPDGDACWYDDGAFLCDLVSIGGVRFDTGDLGTRDKPRLYLGSGHMCLLDDSATPQCWEWGVGVAPRSARVPQGEEFAFIRAPEAHRRVDGAPGFVCGQVPDFFRVVCWSVGTGHPQYRQAKHRFVDGSEWVINYVRDDPPQFYAGRRGRLGGGYFHAFTGQELGPLPIEPSVLVTETIP